MSAYTRHYHISSFLSPLYSLVWIAQIGVGAGSKPALSKFVICACAVCLAITVLSSSASAFGMQKTKLRSSGDPVSAQSLEKLKATPAAYVPNKGRRQIPPMYRPPQKDHGRSGAGPRRMHTRVVPADTREALQ